MNIAWHAGWLRCPQFKPQTGNDRLGTAKSRNGKYIENC